MSKYQVMPNDFFLSRDQFLSCTVWVLHCWKLNLDQMVRSGLEWPCTVAHNRTEMNNVISQQVEYLLIFNGPRWTRSTARLGTLVQFNKRQKFQWRKFWCFANPLKCHHLASVITHVLFVFLFWTSPVCRSVSTIEMSLKWHPLSQQWSYRTEIIIT